MASVSLTQTNRVIALVDMDCFYVQVEERDDPSIKGVPAAVVQYKAFKGGGIIAVNYEARAEGVSRNMRGDDAKAVCPDIQLVRVPESRGKADLTKYRDAGKEVIDVLTEFSSCVERASIDEAYIDLTEAVEARLDELCSQDSFGLSALQKLQMNYFETNFVFGYDSTEAWFSVLKDKEIPPMDDLRLAVGAEIVGQMREAVYKKTQFRCSAGIAHNKVVAKLVCGMNKPNKQTILPHCSVPKLWSSTKIEKVRGLGGKMGDYLTERLGCVQMSDLGRFTEKELSSALGSKTGAWLYQLTLGYDDEAVTPRQLPKSVGCNKNFFGPEALKTKDKAKFWINQLAAEVVERIQRDLETNNRRAKSLTLHIKFAEQNSLSRSCGVPTYNVDRVAAEVYGVLEKLYQTVGLLPINSLGLIASKFEDEIDTTCYTKINDFFKSKFNTESNEVTTNTNRFNGSGISNGQRHASTESNVSYLKDVTSSNSSSQAASTSKNTSTSALKPKSVNGIKKFLTGRVSQSDIPPKPDIQSLSKDNINRESESFFSFSETVPKPSTSPHKSPRKKITTMGSSGSELRDAQSDQSELLLCTDKKCERCGKMLPEWEFLSHMDYHFAKDLSREINGLPPVNIDKPSGNRKSDEEAPVENPERVALKRTRGRGRGRGGSVVSKRGRGSSSGTNVCATSGSTRTIDSFFVSGRN